MKQDLAICLWFDDQAEQAASFYLSIFEDSEILRVSHFGSEGFDIHGKQEGSVMTVDFRLNDMHFIALNGGPTFKFNESISIVIQCDTQQEIDHYWDRLTENGEEGPCGWLKDKYGVSWQVTPSILPDYLTDKDPDRRNRVEKCVFEMKKLDIEKLRKAYKGN